MARQLLATLLVLPLSSWFWYYNRQVVDLKPETLNSSKDVIQTTGKIHVYILHMLAFNTDTKLREITDFSREKLQESIEECVDVISTSLLVNKALNNKEYQRIRTLVENNRRKDASQMILHNVIEKGSREERIIWIILFEQPIATSKLNGTLEMIEARFPDVTINRQDNADTDLSQTLASWTDTKMTDFTYFNRQTIEQLIEQFVVDISQSLSNASVLSSADLKRIGMLAELNRLNDASQLILDILLKNGTHGARCFWRQLLQRRNLTPKLKAILAEKHTTGVYAFLLELIGVIAIINWLMGKCWKTKEITDNILPRSEAGGNSTAKCLPTFVEPGMLPSSRNELVKSIETDVEAFSRSLLNANVLTDREHKEICSLAGNEHPHRASQMIFDIVIERGTKGWTTTGDTFAKMKVNNQDRRKIVSETSEKGNEDFQRLLNFASFTDTQLHRIIDTHRQELEVSIEKFAKDVSRMISDASVFSEEENENISRLAGRNEGKEACQRIFNILFEKGAREERQIWKIFLQLQSYTPKLKETLCKICYEVEEKEDKERIHRNALRNRNMMMIVNITGTDELRRYLLDEKYTNITIVSSLRAQKLMEDKLRARGAKREELQEENLEKVPGEVIELSQLIRSRFDKSKNSNITVVFGAAGIGKSTILQKIIYDWSIGKIYQEFKFVFPFNLRVFNSIDDEICLNSLILSSFPYLKSQLEHLWSEPRSILFIFDDFDEIQPAIDFADVKRDTDSQTQPIHPGCYCKISDLVHCLLKGQLLNGCSVLITSRPWKRETLANVQINLTAEIQGFSSEKTTHFFLQHFGHDHYATEVLKYIERNETLLSLRSNPLYCTVLCSFVEKQLLKRDAMPPSFQSAEVFFSYITSLLERSHCAMENSCDELLKIEALAYEGICNNTLVFTEEKIKQHNLQCSRLSPVFMIEIPGKDPHSFVYSFSHFILQDFMAALMTIQNEHRKKPIRQFQDWQTCSDDRFQVVSCFLVALSSRNPFQRVESSMNKLSVETHSLMSDWLKENCKKLPDKLDDRRSQLMLLKMLHYILEFGDRNTTISALSQLKAMQFTKCHLQPFDYTTISRSLMDIDTIDELNLTTCDVGIEAINQLKNVLHKIIILRLNETKIGDSGVKLLSDVLMKEACKIRTLELKSNKLTDGCVHHLVKALNKNCSLKTLDLSNDSQNGKHANSLTDKSIPELKRISPNNRVLKEIRLMYNQFSAEGQCELKSLHLPDGLVFVTE